MRPLVEIFQPTRLRNGDWCVRAAIHLGGGAVTVTACASELVAARAMAQLQAKVASRLGRRAAYAVAAQAAPMLLLPARASYVGDEDSVAGFFDDIGKTIGNVCKSPIFKSVASGVLKCIPVVGSTLGEAAPGMLDMAGNALAGAKGKKGGKIKKKTRQILERAAQLAAAGNKKAQRQVSLVKAAATVKTKQQAKLMKGTLAAGQLMKKAAAGSPVARARIMGIAERAGQGQRGAIEAAAMLAGVQRFMLPEAPQMYEPDEEWEDIDDLELEDAAVEGLVRSTQKRKRVRPLPTGRSRAHLATVARLHELNRARPGYRRRAA